VEDNLASLRILSQELSQQHNAAVAAQRAVELSVVRFRNGVDSYINVITAQNAFLSARESEVQVQLRQLTASVNLINSLGGGWDKNPWRQTEHIAEHPPVAPADANAAANQAATAEPNPPPLPNPEFRPDEVLKQDQEALKP